MPGDASEGAASTTVEQTGGPAILPVAAGALLLGLLVGTLLGRRLGIRVRS